MDLLISSSATCKERPQYARFLHKHTLETDYHRRIRPKHPRYRHTSRPRHGGMYAHLPSDTARSIIAPLKTLIPKISEVEDTQGLLSCTTPPDLSQSSVITTLAECPVIFHAEPQPLLQRLVQTPAKYADAETQTENIPKGLFRTDCKIVEHARQAFPNSSLRFHTKNAETEEEINSETREINVDNFQYIRGPHRVTNVTVDGTSCVALLLTESLVQQMNTAITQSHKFERLEYLSERARASADVAEAFLENLEHLIHQTESQEDNAALCRTLEERGPIMRKDIERSRKLDGELSMHQGVLRLAHNELHNELEAALAQSQLLKLNTEQEVDKSFSGLSNCDIEDAPESHSDYSSGSEARPLDPEHLTKWEARKAFEQAHERLYHLEKTFEDLRERQQEEIMQYREDYERGNVHFLEVGLDHVHLGQGRDCTRALIEAESEFDKAKAHARAVGAISNGSEGDFTGDGQFESMDPKVQVTVDRERIRSWAAGVLQSVDMEDVDKPESSTADWDIDAIDELDLGDSVSVVDARPSIRKKIDGWRDTCDLIRVELERDLGLKQAL